LITFVRQGNTYQMQIENGFDLKEVLSLDEAIWVAMSAPLDAFQCDAKFLKFVDADSNGSIGSEEMKQAISWLLKQLPDHASITEKFDGKIRLSEIAADNPVGKALVDSANYILKDLAIEDREHISLETIRKFQDIVKNRPLNGDGVLSLNAATASRLPMMKDFLTDAIAATGGVPDIDGTQGVSEAQCDQFLDAIPEYLNWSKLSEIPEGETRSDIMSLGADTPALHTLLNEHAAAVEHFFKLCRLLSFDPRLASKALSPEGKVVDFDAANETEVDSYMQSLPLAQPNPEGMLPLDAQKINPVFRAWWRQVVDKIIRPELPDSGDCLDAATWDKAKAIFNAYAAYLADKKGAVAESVPAANLQRYLECEDLRQAAHDLTVRDKAVAETLKAAGEVERLLLYRIWLLRLVNNFVSFPELYTPAQRALFERGSLVIDGRWFNLAFPVSDLAAHQAQAKLSSLFVLYVEVARSDSDKMLVAVPVTTGSKGNLAIGKRGVFFDLNKQEFPALVVQLIENPVCLAEALVAPFSKAWSMTEQKIETWSSSSEKAFHGKFDKAITPPAPDAAPAAAPAQPAAGAGAFLGISVAFAALGTSFAFISKTIAGMSATAIWVSLICGILALMFPISLLAILKLRRQDLSSLLEGSGWAINSRMRLNNRHRRQFSRLGIYPKDAIGTPRKRGFTILLIIVLLILLAVFVVKIRRQNNPSETIQQQETVAEPAPETPADTPADTP
jgi:hypothetical protein